jgi:hypothetical protein
MSLACLCALSAQHAQKGAVFSSQITRAEFAQLATKYLREATDLVPADFTGHDILDLVRSYGFLALLGSQNGNPDLVQKYLGLYHGLCARNSLHDESRWPATLDDCTTEVRRRLFWAMYRLEVHSACVLGHMIRAPEAQSNVGYPRGIHHPAFVHGRDGNFEDWFVGWNYTTDLYRILEHAITAFRAEKFGHLSILKRDNAGLRESVTATLAAVEQRLLPQFSKAFDPSNDNGKNRSGFQATTILCTLNLVKMVISTLDKNDVERVCQTAHALVDSVRQVPGQYIRATGNPLVQQLSGAGYLLHDIAAKVDVQLPLAKQLEDSMYAMKVLLEELSEHHAAAAMAAVRLEGFWRELHLRRPSYDRDMAGQSSRLEANLELGVQPNLIDPNFLEWTEIFEQFNWPTSMLLDWNLPDE